MNDINENQSDSYNNLEIDKNIVIRIQEIQDLPEEVIIKFIKAAGSLAHSDFSNRFKSG